MGTVEPVFVNIRHNKRLTRLNHRGRTKVNTQQNLYCMVHNSEKLARTKLGPAVAAPIGSPNRQQAQKGMKLRHTSGMNRTRLAGAPRNTQSLNGVRGEQVFLQSR